MKTVFIKPASAERKWFVIDAEGKVLGRVAAKVASILRGKEKAIFVPHQEVGDYVVVINADKIVVTGIPNSDFYFIHQENEEKVLNLILKLCRFSLPKKLGLSPLSTQIQVISPMYRGLAGVDHLNIELQKALNPDSASFKLGSKEYRSGDKVMQTRNNYEKEVFNGDLGTIVQIDPKKLSLLVDFDGRLVSYEKDELAEIVLAYAISVHKAQGNEYQAVVMPLLTQHYIMLQRNLFYTALTRARKLSVIIGSYRALHIAIKMTDRSTGILT